MGKPKSTIISFIAVLALTAASYGCEEEAVRACNSDQDCPASQVCSSNACVETVALNVPTQDVPDQSRPDVPSDIASDTPADGVQDIEPDVPQDGQVDFGIDPDVRPPGDRDYRYVRIDDLTRMGNSQDAGADIDAIVLDKRDGEVVYADSVEAFIHGGGQGDKLDPLDAVGAPDAFYAWPDVSVCDAEGGFVSLGGLGGTLVVGMTERIQPGDVLSVLELGGCDYGGGIAILDPVEVFISVAPTFESDWIALGSGEGPQISFSVPNLP